MDRVVYGNILIRFSRFCFFVPVSLLQSSSMSVACCMSSCCRNYRSTARASASMWPWSMCRTSRVIRGSIRELKWKFISEKLKTVTADLSDVFSLCVSHVFVILENRIIIKLYFQIKRISVYWTMIKYGTNFVCLTFSRIVNGYSTVERTRIQMV